MTPYRSALGCAQGFNSNHCQSHDYYSHCRVSVTPEQALAEARHLYETRKPVGWRAYSMGGIKVANRVSWYQQQVKRAYPFLDWEDAERAFFGDLTTVLAYVNAGKDPNLVGDLLYSFRRLCRNAKGIAERIHESDPADLQRRLNIFGLRG